MLAIMPALAQSEHFRPRLIDPSFYIFYHAPVLILIIAYGALNACSILM